MTDSFTTIVVTLQYQGPLFTFVVFAFAFLASYLVPQSRSRRRLSKSDRTVLLLMQGLVVASFVIDATTMVWRQAYTESSMVYTLSSALMWTSLLVISIETQYFFWYPFVGSWLLSGVLEVTITVYFWSYSPIQERLLALVHVTTTLRLLLLVLFLAFSLRTPTSECDFFSNQLGNMTRVDVWQYLILLPYIWPSRRKYLIFNFVGLGTCLLAERALNFFIPQQVSALADTLASRAEDNTKNIPWSEIILYIYSLFANQSIIPALGRLLWAPIEQYQSRTLSMAIHGHIMDLSCDFHDSKSSSRIIKAVEHGNSVMRLFNILIFSLLPIFVDLLIAVVYLSSQFGAYMTVVMATIAIFYLWCHAKCSIILEHMQRHVLNTTDVQFDIMSSSISRWKSAAYHNQIANEKKQYRDAIESSQRSELEQQLFHSFARGIQQFITSNGLMLACILASNQIVFSQLPVGKFITLLQYWNQFQHRLSSISGTYRNTLRSLIESERLVLLMHMKPTIVDRPDAKPLILQSGAEVIMEDVGFSYPGEAPEVKQSIKGISFSVSAGKKVALVGETGGGKSTILKLLFRFYDVDHGCIKINGQDIRNFTIESLRHAIGVVPQDVKLNCRTVMQNLKYVRSDATDEEVHEACKAAKIHEKILTFEHGYDMDIGEDGSKLSGGEKQRIEIARIILKNPNIIILDEATSAVDASIEFYLQEVLDEWKKQGRTMFVVAHRLSTTMNADTILVIEDGRIIEQGNHDALLRQKNGKYQDLWTKQFRTPILKAVDNSEED